MDKLTRVGTGELLELLDLHHRASDLDGALSGHRGHLGGSHAERGGHCDGCRWVRMDRWTSDELFDDGVE